MKLRVPHRYQTVFRSVLFPRRIGKPLPSRQLSPVALRSVVPADPTTETNLPLQTPRSPASGKVLRCCTVVGEAGPGLRVCGRPGDVWTSGSIRGQSGSFRSHPGTLEVISGQRVASRKNLRASGWAGHREGGQKTGGYPLHSMEGPHKFFNFNIPLRPRSRNPVQ